MFRIFYSLDHNNYVSHQLEEHVNIMLPVLLRKHDNNNKKNFQNFHLYFHRVISKELSRSS